MENTNLQLPPGFRFHPSDEELIVHYLLRKVNSRPLPALIIANIDVYEYSPWELPNKALFGEDEWYFFSPRKRKYSRGARTNRAAASGCWKATGMNQPILTSCGSKSIGVKKALVFYSGPPPKRVKTDWTMIEYTLLDVTTSSTSKRPIIPNPKCKDEEQHINLADYERKISDISESPKKNRLQSIIIQMGPSLPCSMDDWVLCRIRQKGNVRRNAYQGRDSCGMQPLSYSPKIEGLQHTSTNNNADTIKDYRFRESPLLDLIRTGAAPPNQAISEVNSEGSNGGDHFTSANGDGSNGVKSPITISSLDSYFNPSEGTLGLENDYENFISNEKPAESEIDNLPATTIPAYYGMNSYSQNYSPQFHNFNPKHSTISELQQIIDFSSAEVVFSETKVTGGTA